MTATARTILGLSETGFVVLAAAVITGMFGIVVEFVRRDNARTRHENQTQHAQGRETLEQVVGKLDVVHGDVIATRKEVSRLRESHAVHKDRLDRSEKRIDRLEHPDPVVVDWHAPYDDEDGAA